MTPQPVVVLLKMTAQGIESDCLFTEASSSRESKFHGIFLPCLMDMLGHEVTYSPFNFSILM